MEIKGILRVLLIFLLIFLLSSTVVMAYDSSDATLFDSSTSTGNLKKIDNAINIILGDVLSVLRTVAFCIAIIMLMVIGIKYMTAIDPNIKAEYKKTMIPYIIGAVLLFAVSLVLQLATYFVNDVLSTS